MKQFSATELANHTGDVLAAAAQAPVSIARHGKARFVVLTAEQYALIQTRGDSRRAVDLMNLTDDEAARLVQELQHSIDND